MDYVKPADGLATYLTHKPRRVPGPLTAPKQVPTE